MRLAAVLACRNQSSRLYAKPLQNLDVKKKVSILDYLLHQIRFQKEINDVVLAISDQEENRIYQDMAKKYNIPYVTGDDKDVLARLIRGGELVSAENVFRVTTECPYIYFDNLKELYEHHCKNRMDYSLTSGLPDGAFYEIIRLEALKKSWEQGEPKHRSELCSLYIYEHQKEFKVVQHDCPAEFKRKDMRLTVDWPEDLIVMRQIYEGLKLSPEERLDFKRVIGFLDRNPRINGINNWIDSGIGRVWY